MYIHIFFYQLVPARAFPIFILHICALHLTCSAIYLIMDGNGNVTKCQMGECSFSHRPSEMVTKLPRSEARHHWNWKTFKLLPALCIWATAKWHTAVKKATKQGKRIREGSEGTMTCTLTHTQTHTSCQTRGATVCLFKCSKLAPRAAANNSAGHVCILNEPAIQEGGIGRGRRPERNGNATGRAESAHLGDGLNI